MRIKNCIHQSGRSIQMLAELCNSFAALSRPLSCFAPNYLWLLSYLFWMQSRAAMHLKVNSHTQAFRDPDSGVVFEGPEGVSPERDRAGELAFRPVRSPSLLLSCTEDNLWRISFYCVCFCQAVHKFMLSRWNSLATVRRPLCTDESWDFFIDKTS